MIKRLGFCLASLALTLSACAAEHPTRTPVATALATPLAIATPAPVRAAPDLLAQLRAAAPPAEPQALALALQARACANDQVGAARRLAVIDYSRPSTEPRLWVFDLHQPKLLYTEHVAHGRNTGENFARDFSNRDGSHQSSLGLFRTSETYQGGNGYSLRMDGLEPGFNDNARARAIVMHGAAYVDPLRALHQGRLGRSYGCPALRPQVTRAVIDQLKGGQLLFAYYPQPQWLNGSRLLRCGDAELAARGASAGSARASQR
jgi:hypothetical protein